MSDNSLNEEDEEVQLGSYKLEDEYKELLRSPKENTETESDVSTDSSSTSRKQLKSPHTLLKFAPSGSPEGSLSSGVTSPQNDQAEHYQRLLQEAEQSLSSRDVLIEILQEQLKKIENTYKQSLDDTQKLRHKYCVTTQELSNLKTICEKYKEDVEILTKKEKENVSKKELQKLQNEAHEWKTQYKNLLKQVEVTEKEIAATTTKISQEIQVDLLENRNLQTDVNILKDHCVSIKNCLQEQNEKMEFLVRKLQDVQQPHDNQKEVVQKLSNSTEQSLKITEPVNLKESLKSKNVQINDKYVLDEDSHQLNSSGELNDLQKKLENSNLKDEVEIMKIEIEQLNKKNALLQSEVYEIDRLKEEIKKLNFNEELTAPFHFTGAPLDVKDSILETLKQENVRLRGELDTLKNMVEAASLDSNEDLSSHNESIDYPQNDRNRQPSRVSFALTTNHLQSELTQMHQKNSEFRLKIKEQQEDRKRSDEMERLTVELVMLRRQLKQKEEEVDHLMNEVEAIGSRKNAIIQEFQNANQLLKSDYQELLEINNKLKYDLQTKTSSIYEKSISNQSSHEESKPEVSDEIKPEINNEIQELDTVTNDLNKNTTDIIKDAVIQSIYSEMEKLKATLCNKTECETVIEENRKIKDELNGKTKELETIRSNLQIKTACVIEKETIIKSKVSEIEQLKRTINDNNVALQETDQIKNQLDNKRKEIVENATKIQDLQTTINVLKAKLAKALQENENNNKDVQYSKECKCKFEKLEAEVAELTNLTEKLRKENESLKSNLHMMKNTLQQYKEEAEFKKMENEKLRQKEEQLQSEMSLVRRNSEFISREYHKEVENNKIALTEISKECSGIEKGCQNKISKLNVENEELKKLLQKKDEETKELTDKINTITNELETTKTVHEKHLSIFDRSMSEIKFLFKNKEDELISAVNDLEGHQENLQILEEENERLKKLLRENAQEQENKENSLLFKKTMELKTLEENYNNEKTKNFKLNNFLNNIRKDLHNLKIQLQDLLKNLEYKLKLLKNDLLSYKCDVSISKKSVNEMLDYIEKFNSGVLLQQSTAKPNCRNNSTEETENYSYFYEDANDAETFICTTTDCKNKNYTTKKYPSSTANTRNNLPEGNQNLSSITIKELQIKREYLMQKLDSIDQKLNNPDYLSIIKILTPKCIPSSESVLTSHTKNSDRDSYRTCPQVCEVNTEDGHLQNEQYSEKNSLISGKSNTSSIKEDKENKTIENECSTATCADWGKNLGIIQQMASNLHGMQIGITAQGQNSTNILENISLKDQNFQKCPYSTDIQLYMKGLLEQLTTCPMTKDIDDFQHESKSQQSKLQNFQEKPRLEAYANKSYTETLPISTSKDQKNEDPFPDNVKNKDKIETKASEEIDCFECPGCSPQQSISLQSKTDALSQNSYNTSNKIKQDTDNNTSELPNTVAQQKKKSSTAATAIPMLVQNSQKKSKDKSPVAASRNMPKMNNRNIKQNKSKIPDKNYQNRDLNTMNQKPVSQIGTEAKGITLSSCACWKRNSCSPGASHLPVTSNFPKACVFVNSNKKENTPLSENVNYDKNCGGKTIKHCKCGHPNENLENHSSD